MTNPGESLIAVVDALPLDAAEVTLATSDLARVRSCEAVALRDADGTLRLRRLYGADLADGEVVARLTGPWAPHSGHGVEPGVGLRSADLSLEAEWTCRAPNEMSRHVQLWESWDDRYRQGMANFGEEPNASLVTWAQAHAAKLAAGPVLCLGAGYGRDTVALTRLGISSVAIELSSFATTSLDLASGDHVTRVWGDAVRWLDAQPRDTRPFTGIVSIHAPESDVMEPVLAARAVSRAVTGAPVVYAGSTGRVTPAQVRQEWSGVDFTDERWESSERFALIGRVS